MKKLCTTLSKTPNFLNSPTPTPSRLYPFSVSAFSTNFCYYHQQPTNQSHIDQNHEIDRTKIKTLSKPTQIPYQSKVANWVNLIGTIKMPIKFLTCAHGNSWAATLISQPQNSSILPLFWMPVIFQGDLAYTAMMHLKENDMVYIAGNLSSERMPIDLTNNQANVQVVAHNIHFVRGLDGMKKKFSKTPKSFS